MEYLNQGNKIEILDEEDVAIEEGVYEGEKEKDGDKRVRFSPDTENLGGFMRKLVLVSLFDMRCTCCRPARLVVDPDPSPQNL